MFKQKNPQHRLHKEKDIKGEEVWICSCLKNKGSYLYFLSKNRCRCCGVELK